METQVWREKLIPYELAVEELMVKFRHIIKEYQNLGMYSPIELVRGRVKQSSSIIDKAYRKNIPIDRVLESIDDIAGIRIICQFVEDIEKVVEIIRSRHDMTIIKEQNYITNRKTSGYRSYHMTIKYEVQTVKGSVVIPVEIQIRTMAMNYWAVIEHSLQYKYRGDVPPHIKERLYNAADAVLLLDQEMSSIRSEAMDAQHVFREKANMIENIMNVLAHIRKQLTEDEYVKIQDEFYRICKSEDMDELVQFNTELSRIDERMSRRAQ